MEFKCTCCGKQPGFLNMFGKFFANNEGMNDDGEYCDKCFKLRSAQYGLIKTDIDSKTEIQNQHDQT